MKNNSPFCKEYQTRPSVENLNKKYVNRKKVCKTCKKGVNLKVH